MKQDLLARRRRALGPAYRLFYEEPVHLVRGEGVWLYDADGGRYLDCYNNVASVGHCHPRVVEALGRQASTLNTHTRYLHENVVDYAERLGGLLPAGLDVCMFVCTGTEANDLAWRIATTVSGNGGAIVLEEAYHGNSTVVTELSTEMYPAADRPGHLEAVGAPLAYGSGFEGTDAEFGEACAGRVDAALAALEDRGHRPALFVCDASYSSNGVLTPPPEYLQAVYRRVRAAGGLVVADEVQSGLWRLGEHWWGFEDSGVVPDIVTLGKPLGDGHPLAALVTTAEITGRFAERFSYFNTFGGNPVSAAVGLAVLDVIEQEGIAQNVGETGRLLRAGLVDLASRHPAIGEVRGKGLFYGLELVQDGDPGRPDGKAAVRLRERLRRAGVLVGTTGPANNVVKIRPPMVFGPAHADLLLQRLEDALVVP